MPYTFEIVGNITGEKHCELVSGAESARALLALITLQDSVRKTLVKVGEVEPLDIQFTTPGSDEVTRITIINSTGDKTNG